MVSAAVPVFTWTGFYVGVNAGYGWTPIATTRSSSRASAMSAMAAARRLRRRRPDRLQLPDPSSSSALETDIQYADLAERRGTRPAFRGNNNGGNWFGTVRARAGFAFDRALVYATGGLAYGDIGNRSAAHRSGEPCSPAAAPAPTPAGSLGAGVEYAFTNNLTAKSKVSTSTSTRTTTTTSVLSFAQQQREHRVRRGSRWPELQVQQLLRADPSKESPVETPGFFVVRAYTAVLPNIGTRASKSASQATSRG